MYIRRTKAAPLADWGYVGDERAALSMQYFFAAFRTSPTPQLLAEMRRAGSCFDDRSGWGVADFLPDAGVQDVQDDEVIRLIAGLTLAD